MKPVEKQPVMDDRVTTASGRSGTMIDPPWKMPHHCLIQLDTGEKFWILRSAITPAAKPRASPRRRRSAA